MRGTSSNSTSPARPCGGCRERAAARTRRRIHQRSGPAARRESITSRAAAASAEMQRLDDYYQNSCSPPERHGRELQRPAAIHHRGEPDTRTSRSIPVIWSAAARRRVLNTIASLSDFWRRPRAAQALLWFSEGIDYPRPMLQLAEWKQSWRATRDAVAAADAPTSTCMRSILAAARADHRSD